MDGNGKQATEFGGSDDRAAAVAVQADGRIVGAGWTNAGIDDSVDFALARYNTNGAPDGSFGGGDGKVTTHWAGGQDKARAVAIQPGLRPPSEGKLAWPRGRASPFAVGDGSIPGAGRLVAWLGSDDSGGEFGGNIEQGHQAQAGSDASGASRWAAPGAPPLCQRKATPGATRPRGRPVTPCLPRDSTQPNKPAFPHEEYGCSASLTTPRASLRPIEQQLLDQPRRTASIDGHGKPIRLGEIQLERPTRPLHRPVRARLGIAY